MHVSRLERESRAGKGTTRGSRQQHHHAPAPKLPPVEGLAAKVERNIRLPLDPTARPAPPLESYGAPSSQRLAGCRLDSSCQLIVVVLKKGTVFLLIYLRVRRPRPLSIFWPNENDGR
jgi:hypothetical protein